jgi:hypothetical protein
MFAPRAQHSINKAGRNGGFISLFLVTMSIALLTLHLLTLAQDADSIQKYIQIESDRFLGKMTVKNCEAKLVVNFSLLTTVDTLDLISADPCATTIVSAVGNVYTLNVSTAIGGILSQDQISLTKSSW